MARRRELMIPGFYRWRFELAIERPEMEIEPEPKLEVDGELVLDSPRLKYRSAIEDLGSEKRREREPVLLSRGL